MDQRNTSIAPEILQPFLDSATNAAAKGQAQFHTPPRWGKVLAGALPDHRPVIYDLTCGNGSLLRACKNESTQHLLGADIDPCTATDVRKIPFDLTLISSLFSEAGLEMPCVVLNPPWDLWWHRSRLQHLASSTNTAVRSAFAGVDGRTSPGTIDSTVATLLIALDAMSTGDDTPGFGLLIANQATINRLILGSDAPHRAIARHLYAHVVIPGNIMTRDKEHAFGEMNTSVLYFSAGHKSGIKYFVQWGADCDPDNPPQEWRVLLDKRRYASDDSHPWPSHLKANTKAWQAIAEESPIRFANKPKPFNLWLHADGTIAVHLSLWDEAIGKVDMAQARRLNAVDGKRPMQLVINRAERDELLSLCNMAHGTTPADPASTSSPPSPSPFRAAPALQEAIREAVRKYHSERTPLYPLPQNLRMGYLDEQDTILCLKPFAGRFTAGRRYRVESESVATTRTATRPGFDGDPESIEYTGQELAYYIFDDIGAKACFMDPRLIVEGMLVNNGPAKAFADFTLNDLSAHFDIPEVPDISIVLADDYNTARGRLRDLELALAAMGHTTTPLKFKPFQMDDYARVSCTSGAILGHEQGLGKTLAAYATPIARFGYTVGRDAATGEPCILPARPVGIVAPGGLHLQYADDGWGLFRIRTIALDSQQAFIQHSTLHPVTARRTLRPGYYIMSYTQLGLNGTQRIPEVLCDPDKAPLDAIARDWGITTETVGKDHDANRGKDDEPWSQWTPMAKEAKVRAEACRAQQNLLASCGERRLYKSGYIKCVAVPSLADLCSESFDTVCVDEAVRIKNADSVIASGVLQTNPAFRLVLTGTPIKNRVPDIFSLAHWACGGHAEATARFPFKACDIEEFRETFCISEENLTKAAEAKAQKKKRSRFKKYTPMVCNVHKLWKILAPIVLRRRKRDIGEQIVKKNVHIYRVPLGKAQYDNYSTHLAWVPQDRNGKDAIGKQLQALRMVAANPRSGTVASSSNCTPKLMAALTLIAGFIEERKQCILFSPFIDALDTLHRYLKEAGVRSVVLDGRLSESARGKLANQFKAGPDAGIQVALASSDCMSEGYSFYRCSKAIAYSYPWALDKVLQAEDRIYRINSPVDVDVYRLVTLGTIDERMASQIDEKNDAAELILDGKILGDARQELNMAELLSKAAADFLAAGSDTIDEVTLEAEWPALVNRLRLAALRWGAPQATAAAAAASAAKAAPARSALPPQTQAPPRTAAKPLPAWLIRQRIANARAAALAAA